MKKTKFFTLMSLVLLASITINAQDNVHIDGIYGQDLEYNVISTAVPFMMILLI